MCPDGAALTPINMYSLVAYLSGQLGTFLTDLRKDLVPACKARSHVSVLPPREVADEAAARVQVAERCRMTQPFQVSLGDVAMFESSGVIFLEISAAREHLHKAHQSFNRLELAQQEAYPYHPHVTLAQCFPPDQKQHLLNLARQAWAAYPGPRDFLVDSLAFVRNTEQNIWLDLDVHRLGGL